MSKLFPRAWPAWVRSSLALLLSGAAMGAVGFHVGALAARRFSPDAGPLPDLGLGWSDALALLTAFSMLVGMVFVLATSLNAEALGRMYRLEGPASDAEVRQARFQSLVIGFSGVVLILPVVFSLVGVAPAAGLAAVVLLLVLHTVLNVKVYREVDELLRRTTMESATWTFFLGQGVLFLWAAAERMGAAPPITAWDIYAVLMAFYLVVSVVVTTRRGLA